MNKFKEFVNWLIATADNRQADTLTRILCIILVLATGLLVATVSFALLFRLIGAYPVIIPVLIFVVLPSYLWVKFYKANK
jgi:cytochrome c oxidase subunit IV